MTLLGDISSRSAPAGGVSRRALARLVAIREVRSWRSVNSNVLGLDDATVAAFGYERKAVERAGRGPFPL